MADGYRANGFAKGKVIDLRSTVLAANAVFNADLVTEGYTMLSMLFRIGNVTTPAASTADCAVSLNFYENDNQTLYVVTSTADLNFRPPGLSNGVAFVAYRWQLNGVEKVRVNFLNNNQTTGLQGATAIYFLSR